MNPAPPSLRQTGFTFVELLLAMALGALVAGILAALLHGLLAAGDVQAARTSGPVAARNALRALSREISCAFAPPVQDLAPLTLSTSTEPGQPEVRLAFYLPLPAQPLFARGYDIQQVAYEVLQTGKDLRELRRISAPCTGPYTNAPVTNLLLRGNFTLAIEAVTNDLAQAAWPPPNRTEPPALPPALRLSLSRPGEEPLRTEVLIQCAHGIKSPLERKSAEAAEK